MKIITSCIVTGTVLLLTGCGGGSDSSSKSASAQKTYNLSAYTSTTIYMDLEGTNNGAPAEGNYISQYTGDTNYHGTPLAVRENIFNINGMVLSNNAGYYQGSLFGVRNSARTCTAPDASTLPPVPQNAPIGYHTQRTFNCTDGAAYTVEETLNNADGDNALYVLTSKLIMNGNVAMQEVDAYTITPDMHIVAYQGTVNGGGWGLQVHATGIAQN
jgi:hypothetical protein